jgi:hypothetical protein
MRSRVSEDLTSAIRRRDLRPERVKRQSAQEVVLGLQRVAGNAAVWTLLSRWPFGFSSPLSAESRGGPGASGPRFEREGTRIKLYRAMGPDDVYALMRYGEFEYNPHGSGKYFSFTKEDAVQAGRVLYGPGATIVETTVPASFIPAEPGTQAVHQPHIRASQAGRAATMIVGEVEVFYDPNGGGWSLHVNDEALDALNKQMTRPRILESPAVTVGSEAAVPTEPTPRLTGAAAESEIGARTGPAETLPVASTEAPAMKEAGAGASRAAALAEGVLLVGLAVLDHVLQKQHEQLTRRLNELRIRLAWAQEVVPRVDNYLKQRLVFLDTYRTLWPEKFFYLNVKVRYVYKEIPPSPPEFDHLRVDDLSISEFFKAGWRFIGGDAIERDYDCVTSVAVTGPGVPDPVRSKPREPIRTGGSETRTPIRTGGSD